MPATGSSSCDASQRRPHDDEPPAVEQHLAGAELGGQPGAAEIALVDLPFGAVLENPPLNLLVDCGVGPRGVDDDELCADSRRLAEQRVSLVLQKVAIEMAGEDAVEAVVRKRQRERLA